MSTVPSNTKKLKALIVDDDNDLLEMLTDIFNNAGFKVVTATDGVDGSFKYNNETFDIIITDIKMPKKDGVKFVQHIQASEAQKMLKAGSGFKSTPIILVSASLEDYKVEIELLQNIEVQSKPFSPKDILDKVKLLIDKKSDNPSASGVVVFKAGEFVIREGENDNQLYFVKEGSLQVLKKGANGANVVVTNILAGEMIGEMGFLLHKSRTASVRALTDCTLIGIPKEKFESIINVQPKWFKVLFQTISSRLEETTRLLVAERAKNKS